MFDENTRYYISTQRERVAFLRPRTSQRTITAVVFDDDNQVTDVLAYDETDGQVISYASKETPMRGRELSILEQLFGNIGAVALPRTDEATPGNPTGRR